MSFTSTLVTAALLFAGSAAAKDLDDHHKDGACKPLHDLVAGEPLLTDLAALMKSVMLPEMHPHAGHKLTLFAPTNSALEALPEGTADALAADPDALRKVIKTHIAVDGALLAADLDDGMTLNTAAALSLTVHVSQATGVVITAPSGGTSAVVLTPDLVACDAVVHLVDTVLLPGTDAPEVAVLPVDQGKHAKKKAMHVDEGVITVTPGKPGDVALEPPTGAYGEDVMGMYGDDGVGAYGVGTSDSGMEGSSGGAGMTDDEIAEMGADGVADRSVGSGAGTGDSETDSIMLESDTASAGVVIAGAVVAGVVAVLAGVAVVAYTKRAAAGPGLVTGLSGQI